VSAKLGDRMRLRTAKRMSLSRISMGRGEVPAVGHTVVGDGSSE